MRVMVIGASTDRSKYGNKAVRAYLRQGHEVFPVHPWAERIEGQPAYRDVRDVPGPIDRVTLYLPPDVGVAVIAELAERDDVNELWVNPGAESDELVSLARRLGFEVIQACSIVDIGERP